MLDLRAPQLRRVLGVLLVNSGRPVSGEAIAEALWDDADPSRSVNAVQVYVSRLRQRLADGSDGFELRTLPAGYQLEITGTLDSVLFKELISQANATSEARIASPILRRALNLWRGPALVDLRGRPVFDVEAEHLERLRLAVQEDWLESELALSRHRQIVDEAEAMVGEEPLRERRWGQLMTALYRCGRQAEALTVYRRAREVMIEELGVEPSPDLASLEQKVLEQDASLLGPSTPVALDRAPLGNLPPERDAFIGRSQETAEVEKLLRGARLVTVVGVGGAGKSRIARHVAGEISGEFQDGAWWIALSEATGSLVANVGAQLGMYEPANGGWDDHLVQHLTGRQVLIILDAAEFLLDEAASFVEMLQSRLDGVVILVTSRSPLALSWEVTYRLAGMTVPAFGADPRAATATDSVRLFIARSQLTQGGPDHLHPAVPRVAELVRRLDGLPLGIELVAAGLRQTEDPPLALARVESKFRDTPTRHRSLRTTFEWSLEQCTEPTRLLFSHLCVFVGRFASTDVEAVSTIGVLAPPSVEPALEELRLRSLLERTNDGTFFLLDTVREYAREKAIDAGIYEDLQHAHSDHFLGLVEQVGPGLARGEPTALETVDERLGDIRTALLFTVEYAPQRAMTVMLQLREFMLVRGRSEVFGDLTRQMLELVKEPADQVTLAARCMLGSCTAASGTYAGEQELVLEEALARGDLHIATIAAWDLTYSARNAGLADEMERYGIVMANLANESADPRLQHWAILARTRVDQPGTRSRFGMCREWFSGDGDLFGEAWALYNCGWISLMEGDHRAGSEELSLALERFEAMEHPWGMISAGIMSAIAAIESQDANEAERLATQVTELQAQLGLTEFLISAEISCVLGHAALLRGEHGEAERLFANTLFPPEKWDAVDTSTALPWALVGMAEATAAVGDWEQSAIFAEAAHRTATSTRWIAVVDRVRRIRERGTAAIGSRFSQATSHAGSPRPLWELAEMTDLRRRFELAAMSDRE